jgi:hypothetical protein
MAAACGELHAGPEQWDRQDDCKRQERHLERHGFPLLSCDGTTFLGAVAALALSAMTWWAMREKSPAIPMPAHAPLASTVLQGIQHDRLVGRATERTAGTRRSIRPVRPGCAGDRQGP